MCKSTEPDSGTSELYDLIYAASENDSITLNKIWNNLSTENSIPYTFDDSVYFLYKGKAESVVWNGDFNRWSGDTSLNTRGIRIGESDLWMYITSFHPTSRLDYKIVVDGKWILDPAHDNYQHTGMGGIIPNSELRMPEYRRDSFSPNSGNRSSKLGEQNSIKSTSLGYEVVYKVLLPSGYDSLENLPLLILTDGHEFLHEKLGNFELIYDHLLSNKLIEPLVVVLIDPRNPNNEWENRRLGELGNNPDYAQFITEELLEMIQSKYKISNNREDRAIGGVSLGGLNAAYISALKPEVFGKIGILSPAFWYKPEIYDMWESIDPAMFKVYLSTGTYGDMMEGAEQFHELAKSSTIKFDSIYQSHSWGNWRDMTDDMLIYLFGR